ncbi:MAG TPA: hypothetical protein VEZ90_02965, partial [Blastocatellia bacterium]|nr:hypothetical protein [Blastocatellia bacterium]
MNRLGSLVVHRPWLVIALTFFVTALLGAAIAIRGVRFDGSIETLTRKDSDFAFFNQVRSLFGDDRVIVVAITTSDVFNKTFVDKLSAMTSHLATVKGVEAAESLINAKSIRRSADGVEVDYLLPRDASDADLQ